MLGDKINYHLNYLNIKHYYYHLMQQDQQARTHALHVQKDTYHDQDHVQQLTADCPVKST